MNFINNLSDSKRRFVVRSIAVLGVLNAVLFVYILNPESSAVDDFSGENLLLKLLLDLFVIWTLYMTTLYTVCVILTSSFYEKSIIAILVILVGIASAGTYHPVSYTITGATLAVFALFYAGRKEKFRKAATIDDVMGNRDDEWINMASIDRYNIQFGFKRDDVTRILGKPYSSRIIKIGENYNLDCWEYDLHKIELIYDSDNDFRLSQISFLSKQAEVNGIKIIGLSEKELLKKLPKLSLLDEKDEIGYNYGIPGENIQIYVSEGVVDSFCIHD